MFQNRATTYAILSVVEIAKQHAAGTKIGIQANEIAETYGLPMAYAAKVMSQLARSRVLRSDRGPKGGFQLARDAKEVTLLEVIDAVGSTIDGRLDAEQTVALGNVQSGLADVYGAATDGAREVLGGITVGEFIDKYCK